MQVSQSDFNILFTLKHTDQELYACYLLSLDLSEHSLAGTFERSIFTCENSALRSHSIKVLRTRTKGDTSFTTHSLRPDFLLANSQFSIRFILLVIYHYYHDRNCTISDLLARFDITRSTLYIWLDLFKKNQRTWFLSLHNADKLANDILSQRTSIPSAPRSFLCLKGFAFLESFDPPFIILSENPP